MNRSFTENAEEAMTLPQSEQLRLARTLLEKAEASGTPLRRSALCALHVIRTVGSALPVRFRSI